MCVMIWLDAANMALPPWVEEIEWYISVILIEMHSCTGIQFSSWKPDLFSDQTSSLSRSLSFIAPSQLSVWRISFCSQPWDWIILLCCFVHPGEGNNEPAFLHSFIHPTSLYLSVNTHGNLERTFYKKTPIMGCHFFDVHVNTSYNVIPTYFSY